MAAHPSIGNGVHLSTRRRIRPAREQLISQDGTKYHVDKSYTEPESVTLVYRGVTKSELTTAREFFNANREGTFTESVDGDTLTLKYLAPPQVTDQFSPDNLEITIEAAEV